MLNHSQKKRENTRPVKYVETDKEIKKINRLEKQNQKYGNWYYTLKSIMLFNNYNIIDYLFNSFDILYKFLSFLKFMNKFIMVSDI